MKGSRSSSFSSLILFAAFAVVGIAAESALTPAAPYPQPNLAAVELLEVMQVIDATTLHVASQSGERDVKLIGVTADPAGDVAKYLSQLLTGENVYVADDSVSNDGVYVYRAPDGLPVNLELVRLGYASVVDSLQFAQRAVFESYQQRAMQLTKGMWGSGSTASSQPRLNDAPTPPADGSTIVYVTTYGKKYHISGCEHLAKSKIPISLTDAKARNYGPCQKCNPPQ